MRWPWRAWTLGFLAWGVPWRGLAHFADRYGMGVMGTASARALSARCQGQNFAAYYNPALLACAPGAGIELSYVHTAEDFPSITGVTRRSNAHPIEPGTGNESGNFSTDYPDHHALQLGFHFPLFHQWRWLKERNAQLGISIHYNVDHAISAESYSAYSPVYSLFEKRDQRLFLSFSTGLAVVPDRFWVGVGADYYLTTGARNTIIIASDQTTGSFGTDVASALAVIVGVRGRMLAEWPLYLSISFHQKVDPTIVAEGTSRLSAVPLPVILNVSASLYSDPNRLRISASWEEDRFDVEGGVLIADWKNIGSPRLVFLGQGEAKNSVTPSNRYSNTATYFLGGSARLSRSVRVLGGLSFEPSIVDDISSRENEIDSDKFIWGVGARYSLTEMGIDLGLAYQMQVLMEQRASKADADMLGYPGYDVGGLVHAVQLGVSGRW